MIWLLLVFLLFHCNILLHRGKLVVEMVREVGFGQQCDQAEMVAEMQRAAQPQSSRWSGSQVDREKKHRCNRALTRLLFSHESGVWATARAASFVGQMMVCSATLLARPVESVSSTGRDNRLRAGSGAQGRQAAVTQAWP